MISKPLEREFMISVVVGGVRLWFLIHARKKQRTCGPQSAPPPLSVESLSLSRDFSFPSCAQSSVCELSPVSVSRRRAARRESSVPFYTFVII